MEQLYYEEESFEEEKIDFQKYFHILLRRKWLIIFIALVVTIPWVIYQKSRPPIYEATTMIRFKDYASGNDPELAESRITELTSRSFAERVVAQLGLALELESRDKDDHLSRHLIFQDFSTSRHPKAGSYYFLFPKDGTYSLFFIDEEKQEHLIDSGLLYDIIEKPKTINGFTFRLISSSEELPEKVEFRIRQFRNAVESLRERIEVRLTSSNLMSLKLADTDPVMVTRTVNRLAEIFVEESISLKRKTVQSRRKILEEKLALIEKKVEESENALKAFKESHFVSLDSEVKNQVDEYARLKGELEGFIEQKRSLTDLLKQLTPGPQIGSEEYDRNLKYIYRQIAEHPTFVGNNSMGILKNKLGDLEAEREQIIKDYSKEHTKAKELEKEIKDVHSQIRQTAENHLDQLNTKISFVTKEINKIEYQLKTLPAEEYRLTELTRDRKVNQDLYATLLAEYQKAEIDEAVETEDIDILDPAIIPEYPVNKDKKQKAIMGGIFSIMLGIAVALALEFLDKSIKTVDDVKKFLRLQVLGTIPNIDFKGTDDFRDSEKIKQIDNQLVTHDYSPTPVGEAYRSLRTNLVFSKTAGKIQTIVITSSAPGDGKSFTSSNVAIAMAQQKNKTLLVDADLRRGVLHNTFGIPKEPGFTNFLTNMVYFQQIVREIYIPNLFVISCGAMLPNPSELLGSVQMQRFLDLAKRKFDIIIFDTPPLNAATDAVVIGTQVDVVVLVVRSGITDRDVARKKLEMFNNVPAKVLGVVLNGTTAELAHEGYSYYHY